jgi:hypothetical protein
VLVPLPAANDHQRKNAEALVAAGAADMLCSRMRAATRAGQFSIWRRSRCRLQVAGAARSQSRTPRDTSIGRWRWSRWRRNVTRSDAGSADSCRKNRSVHFIGIGRIGMSGIAELRINLGWVSGSDENARGDRAPRHLGVRVMRTR